MKPLRFTLIALCALSIVACSSNKKDPLQYKTAGAGEIRLDVPPDLTTPKNENRYSIPGGTGSATATQTSSAPNRPYNNTVLSDVKDMSIERDGNQRWLAIKNKQPAEVWPVLKIFWQEMGFVVKSEEPEVGLLETDWAENRAKLPNDGLRGLLEKVGVGSIYSTPERDKFMIRMEKTDQGTEVFFSHKGLYEIFTNERKEKTAWQPRPSDPELEAAFLGRFMVRLGMSEENAQLQVAKAESSGGARAQLSDNALVLNDSFDRAWRRVGLALDRVGLTVTDRNRTEGIYFVKPALQEANIREDSPGFFKRLLGGKKKTGSTKISDKEELRVRLIQTSDNTTTVIFLDDSGQKMTTAEVKTALSRLQTELQ